MGEILVNQLFAGGYLEEGENIGHEVINLFSDDEGNNNLFITKDGQVGNHEIDSILFVRHIKNKQIAEVVMLAKQPRPVSKEEEKNVRYGGVPVTDIFRNNVYRGKGDGDAKNVTFRAEKIVFPSKRIFISVSNDEDILKDIDSSIRCVILESCKKSLTPQSMRTFFSEKVDSSAYESLKKLIEDSDCWDESKTTEKIVADRSARTRPFSFLEVIGKVNDELAFSNLFQYFFEYSHAGFQKFAKDVLGIPDMDQEFTILREEKNIDIWIEGAQNIVVIENKIKSGINGVKNESEISQLSKYYEYTEGKAGESSKKARYYVFAPDYAQLDLKRYKDGDNYTLVRYSQIYEHFAKEIKTYISDPLYKDFLLGLEHHTYKSIPEMQLETMRFRLMRRIASVQ